MALRTNRILKSSGLTKVAGNILGSALGSASPANSLFSSFIKPSGRFSTNMYSFPMDVATDPFQGHYINFSIFEVTPSKVAVQKGQERRKARRLLREAESLLASPGGATGAPDIAAFSAEDEFAGFANQKIVDARLSHLKKLDTAADKLTSGSGAGGTSILLKRSSTKKLGTVISLYMPPNITVNYTSNYTDNSISVVAEAGSNFINAIMEGSRPTRDAIQQGLESATQGAKQAILATLDTFAPGARALYAIEKGQIITPRMELMFNNIGRREFSYSFVFIPRDQKESEAIEEIVRAFKSNMTPNFLDTGTVAGMRTMTVPNIFKIEYMYQNGENKHLNTIGHCALTRAEVSYGSDRFVSYEGGYPQTTKLSLNFTELDIITKAAILEKGR